MINSTFFKFLKIILILTIISCSSTKTSNYRKIASETSSCYEILSLFLKDSKLLKETEIKNIILNQEENIDNLIPKLGHSNYNEFISAVESFPEFDDMGDIILDENVNVAMYVPSNIREEIIKDGFKNQHETLTTGGRLNIELRSEVEATHLGITKEEYSNIDNAIRPKYALLAPKDNKMGIVDTGYGDDIFIFDINKIKKKITVTPGDSLSRYEFHQAIKPGANMDSWDFRFIPWSRRGLLIPAMADISKQNKKLMVSKNGRSYSPLENYNMAFPQGMSDYAEVQIWGNVNLKHVKKFIYKKEPPKGRFLEILKKNKIEIINGKENSP